MVRENFLLFYREDFWRNKILLRQCFRAGRKRLRTLAKCTRGRRFSWRRHLEDRCTRYGYASMKRVVDVALVENVLMS